MLYGDTLEASSEEQKRYRALQKLGFFGIYLGYASLYLIRNSFNCFKPELIKEGFQKESLGFAWMWFNFAYGFSKFFMGQLSVYYRPRVIMTVSLLLSACFTVLLGLWAPATHNLWIMSLVLLLMGVVQGLGFPPCAYTLMHWWTPAQRGAAMGVWNTAQNLGNTLMPLLPHCFALSVSWRMAGFVWPGVVVMALALPTFFLVCDPPEAYGLHPGEAEAEASSSFKDLFLVYILPNRKIWYLLLANGLTYWIRFGVQDWATLYLQESKGFSSQAASQALSLFEFSGIPGVLLCGWVSDRFKGRRVLTGGAFMMMVTLSLLVYAHLPPQYPCAIVGALFAIGFFLYGPMMLYGLCAMEMLPKAAAGPVTGFIGLAAYLFSAVMAQPLLGLVCRFWGWSCVMQMLACVGVVCTALIVRVAGDFHPASREGRC